MFIMSVAVGIALTLSYDLLRVFRRVVSHNSILIAMEDVCFWLIWTYVTLECIHVYGDGVLHWYMAVGILFGVVLFHYTISCALLKSVNNILYKVKSSTKKSVRYRQSPVITFLVVAAVIFICVTSIVRATSLHTKSKQLAETEKTMELKVEEAKQEQANLDAQEKYMQTNEYIEDVAKDKLGLVKPDELVIRPAE